MSPSHTSRRTFIRNSALSLAAVAVAPVIGFGGRSFACAPAGSNYEDPWDQLPEILARIRPPGFPDRDFLITDFGAEEGDSGDASQAISDAITACADAGGGRVVVPAGLFMTGPVVLRSNVNLHVADGATLRFHREPERYPLTLTRYEGVELMNYSPFIYAFGEENVAITGGGTLDGNGDCEHWWPWKGRTNCGWSEGDPREHPERARLFQLGEEGVPVEERIFGDGSYIRPNFIEPYNCRNVLIEGVTVTNSPMWCLHPTLCENVTIRGVRVVSHGPNNDGCNPESCRDVLIEDCYFDTGDDCIAIKSGRNAEGRRLAVPSENIIIRRCHMRDGHGGVVIGSEMSGGVRNVFAEDCEMDSPNLDRALRFKTNSVRGGTVENVFMRNVTVGEVADALFRVNFYYEEGDEGNFPPVVRNIEMRNVTSRKAQRALYVVGYPNAPVMDVRIIDCTFDNVAEPSEVRNVQGLQLTNVYVNGQPFTLDTVGQS